MPTSNMQTRAHAHNVMHSIYYPTRCPKTQSKSLACTRCINFDHHQALVILWPTCRECRTASALHVCHMPTSDGRLALPNIYADYEPRCESTYAEGHLSNTCVLSRRVNVWRHRVGALRRLRVMASSQHEASSRRNARHVSANQSVQ